MTPSAPIPAHLWPQISALFDELLDAPEGERSVRLGVVCQQHPELAEFLQRLLAAHNSAVSLRAPEGELFAVALGTSVQLLAPGQDIGIYRLVEPLGKGGMASVWAVDQLHGVQRRVALKLPFSGLESPEAMAQRFAQERDMLAGLEHPHVARLYDAGVTASGQPFLAMELVHGQPITAYCQPLPLRRRLVLFLQVLEAVSFAHGRLVIHRDIKPSNVLVTADGHVKLLDFGIARLFGEHEQLSDAAGAADTIAPDTIAPAVPIMSRAFTPDYASPEQLSGDALGAGSDVYSLGVVLFELLTGQAPYRLLPYAPTPLFEQLQALRVRRPSEASPAARRVLAGDLDAIVVQALAHDTQQRYASVEAMATDIRRWLDSLPVHARAGGTVYRISRFARRHRVVLAAGVVVGSALLAGLGIALWQAEKARTEAARAQAVQDLLVGFFDGVSPNQLQGKALGARELIMQGSERAERTLQTQPELRAELLRVTGLLLLRLRENGLAAARLEDALKLISEQEGEGSARAIETRFNLVEALSFAEPQRALMEAGNVQRLGARYFGVNHPWAMRVGIHMGWIERQLGAPLKAIADVRAALQLPAPDRVDVAALTLTGQATIREAQLDLGQYAQARQTFAAILVRAPAAPAFGASNVLAVRYGLLGAYGYSGDFDAVIKHGLPLLVDVERTLGPRSDMALLTRESLAQALARLGRFTDALRMQEPVLRAYDEGPDRDSENVYQARAVYAQLLAAAGRADEALPLARAAVRFFDKAYPQPEILRETRRYWLALALIRADRLREAAPVLAQTIANMQVLPGVERNPRFADVLLAQGMVAWRLGNRAAAVQLLTRACALTNRAATSVPGPRLRCAAHLAFVQAAGADARSMAAFEKSANAYLRSLPAGHVVAAELQLLRSELLSAAGRHAAAAREQRHGMAAWQRALERPATTSVVLLH